MGAIVNNGTNAQQNALRFVTLTGNTTFGGTARWDIRTDNPTTTPATLTGNGFDVTKVGTNSVYFVNLGDTDLGNINVNNGILVVQGTTKFVDGTTGDLAKPITLASGANLSLWSLAATNPVNKKLVMQGGIIETHAGAGTNNTYAGEVTLAFDPITSTGGKLNIYGSATENTTVTISGNIAGVGPLTKVGLGTAKLTGTNTFSGLTVINGGDLILTGSVAGGVSVGDAMGAGTLSGTGTINGDSNDYSGAIIAPGATLRPIQSAR